jgi:hypothetical protein
MSNTTTTTTTATFGITKPGEGKVPVTVSERKVPVTVSATEYDDFTVTSLAMALRNEDGFGKVEADAFDADRLGSHMGVNVHGVTGVEVEDGMFGPIVKFRTESGLTLSVTAYAARTGTPSADPRTDERVAITWTDNRS